MSEMHSELSKRLGMNPPGQEDSGDEPLWGQLPFSYNELLKLSNEYTDLTAKMADLNYLCRVQRDAIEALDGSDTSEERPWKLEDCLESSNPDIRASAKMQQNIMELRASGYSTEEIQKMYGVKE